MDGRDGLLQHSLFGCQITFHSFCNIMPSLVYFNCVLSYWFYFFRFSFVSHRDLSSLWRPHQPFWNPSSSISLWRGASLDGRGACRSTITPLKIIQQPFQHTAVWIGINYEWTSSLIITNGAPCYVPAVAAGKEMIIQFGGPDFCAEMHQVRNNERHIALCI